ncbi:MAG: hypothetical protein R3E08_07225 [Thiotrichaceae bacterium]
MWSKDVSDQTVLPTFLLSGMLLPVAGSTNSIAVLNSHFKYRATIASAIGVLNPPQFSLAPRDIDKRWAHS